MSIEAKLPLLQIGGPVLGEDEWRAMLPSLLSGQLTQGPQIDAFEQEFAAVHQVPYAVAASNGTTALHLILAAMGIGPGDEVVVPAFTMMATANAVVYTGATPVLVDVDPKTYNLDPAALKAKLSSRTRAIFAVHLFGLCAAMDEIKQVAGAVPVLEDAACAAGAAYRGRSAGSLGAAAAFSFHPRKTLTTGEGGMVTTADRKLADAMRILRNHGGEAGVDEHGNAGLVYKRLGFNYRLSELQAAIGRVQLAKLRGFIEQRVGLVEQYRQALSGIGWLQLPAAPEGYRHSWQAYVTLVAPDAPKPRGALLALLREAQIQGRPGTQSIADSAYYRDLIGAAPAAVPQATACAARTLALPLHNKMGPADVERVARVLRRV